MPFYGIIAENTLCKLLIPFCFILINPDSFANPDVPYSRPLRRRSRFNVVNRYLLQALSFLSFMSSEKGCGIRGVAMLRCPQEEASPAFRLQQVPCRFTLGTEKAGGHIQAQSAHAASCQREYQR